MLCITCYGTRHHAHSAIAAEWLSRCRSLRLSASVCTSYQRPRRPIRFASAVSAPDCGRSPFCFQAFGGRDDGSPRGENKRSCPGRYISALSQATLALGVLRTRRYMKMRLRLISTANLQLGETLLRDVFDTIGLQINQKFMRFGYFLVIRSGAQPPSVHTILTILSFLCLCS